MAQITILVTRFLDIRKLLTRIKYIDNRKGRNKQSYSSIYNRQRARKREQQILFKTDPRFKEFFSWIFSIQKRLNASDKEFARLCGVTPQTISMWRNFANASGGVFPSVSIFNNLIRLEVVCQAEVIIKKNITNKINSAAGNKVKIPRSRIRLRANVYY